MTEFPPSTITDWRKLGDWLRTHPTESNQTFTYAGWSEFIKDTVVESPEVMLNKAIAELSKNFDALVKPHSPTTPEEAAVKATQWEVAANAAHIGVMAAVVAVEAVGLGQMETPCTMALANPEFSSLMEAAKSVRMAYFDSTFIEGTKYNAKKDHMPTVIPSNSLIDAVEMALIPDNLYIEQMKYHGFTPERSAVLKWVNIRMPDVQSILEMLRRGVIQPDGALDWLVLNKIPRDTSIALLSLATNIPEPYRIADMASKGVLNTDELHSSMHWYGIGEYFADKWKLSLEQQPSFEQLITMVNRELISTKTYENSMLRTGISTYNAARLLALKDIIPPVGDLIRFAVREAFPVPAGEQQFLEAQKYAKLQGLSAFWMNKYWLAHFTRMPLTTAYQNLWRGRFDIEDFEYYLLLADIHPDDWDSIEAVAFQPPNTRELGYGFDVGVYTEEDVAKYRRWGGLSPEDADRAAKSLVLYRTETERNQVRTAAMYLYGTDKMTLAQFKVILTETLTSPAAIELWIRRADLYHQLKEKPEMDTEGRIVSSSEAIAAFKLKLRDETWLRQALKNLTWTDERIKIAVERAQAEIAEDEAKAKEVKYKDLTIAQLKDMYDLKLITDADYFEALVDSGYSEEDAMLLVDVYTHVEEKPVPVKLYTEGDMSALYDLTLMDGTDIHQNFIDHGYDDTHAIMLTLLTIVQVQLPNLKARYSKGWIDENTMYSEIVAMGVPPDRANLLMEEIVKNTQQERVVAEKDLTKAEIIKGYKSGVIDTAQAIGLLMDLGYSEDEATYLLLINTVVAAGDPKNYYDMKRVVEAYKKAIGEESVTISEDVVNLANKIQLVKADLKKEKNIGANEEKIAQLATHLSGLELQLRQLLEKKPSR